MVRAAPRHSPCGDHGASRTRSHRRARTGDDPAGRGCALTQPAVRDRIAGHLKAVADYVLTIRIDQRDAQELVALRRRERALNLNGDAHAREDNCLVSLHVSIDAEDRQLVRRGLDEREVAGNSKGLPS